ncbi:MAG: hypothetical protein ACR2KK_13420 [Acidimicrobiales bacterium]
MRDLCRTRGDMVEDLTRARNRLTKFLAPPLPGVAGRVELDGQARGLAGGAELLRAGPGHHLGHYRAVVLARECASR